MSNTATTTLILSIISLSDGKTVKHVVQPGSTTLIGSDALCAIRLPLNSISPKHCFIRFEDGKLTIQDWCSETGTRVNGQTIQDETVIGPESKIELGDYEIKMEYGESTMEEEDFDDEADVYSHDEPTPTYNAYAAESNRETVDDHSNDHSTSLPGDDDFEYDTPPSHDSDVHQSVHDDWETQSLEQEKIALLEDELELLRSELAERDSRLMELEELNVAGAAGGLVAEENSEQDGSEKIQELLEELERNDQRIRMLEDLLRLTEDASQAEKEERHQIESWINGLEQRVAEREAEWKAEVDVQIEQVTKLKEIKAELEKRLTNAVSNTAIEEHEKEIHRLRAEIEKLNEHLKLAERARLELQKRLESADIAKTLENQEKVIAEAIREEHLKIARERAEFSRQRAELLKRVSDLEYQSEGRRTNEADERFKAFRDHLKEIHAEGKDEDARPAPSIGQRLVDLWRRLDGPTDTD